MRNSIVRKLLQHLSTPIDTECKVVYLLCELRKLFNQETPIGLQLCANWALHVDLDRNIGAQDFLHKVDVFVVKYLATGEIPDSIFDEFLFIGSLRKEFGGFLGAHGLPTEICENDDRWFEFINAYAGVIDEGSLACRGGDFGQVTKLVFSKGRDIPDADLPFTVDWEIWSTEERSMLHCRLVLLATY